MRSKTVYAGILIKFGINVYNTHILIQLSYIFREERKSERVRTSMQQYERNLTKTYEIERGQYRFAYQQECLVARRRW